MIYNKVGLARPPIINNWKCDDNIMFPMECRLRMKTVKHIVRESYEEFILDKGSADGFLLSFLPDCQLLIYIQIYSLENEYIGQVHLGYTNFPKSIYLSDEKTSINGTRENLKKSFKEAQQLMIKVTTLAESPSFYYLEINLEEMPWEEGAKIFGQTLNLPYKSLFIPEVKAKAWTYYRGDFHGHTNFSDGHIKIEEVPEYLLVQGLDFMAMTDHNAVACQMPLCQSLLIPSFEMTLPFGHINIHGVESCEILDKKRLALLEHINSKHLIGINELLMNYSDSNISLNHMFMKPWDFQMNHLDLSLVNTIEVICDPTYPTASDANDKAIDFLDYLWTCGLQIYGIGGSDCHQRINELYQGANRPSVYGDPSTYVSSKELSSKAILKGIKEGRSYVSRFCQIDLIIDNGQILPGEAFNKSIIDYYVKVNPYEGENLDGYIAYFVLDGIKVKQIPIGKNLHFECNFTLDYRDYHWIRFGIMDPMGHHIAYVNPIYCNRKTPDTYILGDMIEEFHKHD